MHTAICTFEDRAAAEQAAQRLVEAGFDRREVHVEHRHADGTPMPGGDAGGERDGMIAPVTVDSERQTETAAKASRASSYSNECNSATA